MRTLFLSTIIILLLFLSGGCTKEFLNVKPDKRLSIPSTIDDLDAMLNNRVFFAQASLDLGAASNDDFYIRDEQWSTLTSKYAKNAYVFARDIFEDEQSNDWNRAYERILYANVILAHIDTIKAGTNQQRLQDEIQGGALFHRASNHYQLVQLFCPEYDLLSSSEAPCIPIRDDFDLTKSLTQSTVSSAYDFMINDLKRALDLLPDVNTIYRPSKAATHLLLARIYLHMEDYDLAFYHSDLGLKYRSELMDISILDSTADYVFPVNLELHPEIILNFEGSAGPATIAPTRQNISMELLDLYETNDLRKTMFFRTHSNGNIIFRGSYRPRGVHWGGFSTNELWLIRAESSLRLGNISGALNDLNYLLYFRYQSGTYVPISSNDPMQVLTRILQERRKELLFRGTRWEDLKRMNKDANFAKDLIREVDGQQYLLPINSPNWVFPFPKLEVELHNWSQVTRE